MPEQRLHFLAPVYCSCPFAPVAYFFPAIWRASSFASLMNSPRGAC
jgi:hypothetical protein